MKTPEQIHYNMSRIRNKDTKIEIQLRKELWSRGLRYRKNDKSVEGKPDIVFKGPKVAVFCDSEFWHGYDWEHWKYDIKTNRDFWINKIERNRLCVTTSAESIVRNAVADGCLPTGVFSERPFV
ncbi:MAG: very short patch repair endonuclease [Thermoplasmata archaeon]|nr:very short patch repair endonuclease [Thermoplasmata archaeon]